MLALDDILLGASYYALKQSGIREPKHKRGFDSEIDEFEKSLKKDGPYKPYNARHKKNPFTSYDMHNKKWNYEDDLS